MDINFTNPIYVSFAITGILMVVSVYPFANLLGAVIRMYGLPLDPERLKRAKRRVMWLMLICMAIGAGFAHMLHAAIELAKNIP